MNLRKLITNNADDIANAWLDTSVRNIESDPAAIRRIFPAVSRTVGVKYADGWRMDDAARVLLVQALSEPEAELLDLYSYGDANERRAVLLSLDYIKPGESGTTLVRDALRTNDANLVAASLGPFAFAQLSPEEIRQAIMKCVFMDISLDDIDGIDEQASPELSRMLAGFIHERVAAGRSVDANLWTLIDRYPPANELASIKAELDSPFEDRRKAATDALAGRV